MNASKVGLWSASVVAVLAVAAAVSVGVVDSGQVTKAQAAERTAQAKPPVVVTKTVTKQVPVFGESVLYGAYAQGQIKAGFYMDGSGNQVYTPDDEVCSKAYGEITSMMPPDMTPIDRTVFMNACETDVNTTARQDPGK